MSDATYIGRSCKRGHYGLRYKRTRNCVACHKATAAERYRRYRDKNPERSRESVRRYQASEKGVIVIEAYKKSEARRASLKRYNSSEKKKIASSKYCKTEKYKEYVKGQLTKPTVFLARSLRDRVRHILKRGKGKRPGSAVRDLGCSLEFFRGYIEAKFDSPMSWDNYGGWHLDHIKPLARFDLSNREQFLQAVHYTNYQPLWAADNWKKGASYG